MMREKIPEPSKRFILGHFIWVDTSKIIPKNLGTTWRIVEKDIEKDDHLQWSIDLYGQPFNRSFREIGMQSCFWIQKNNRLLFKAEMLSRKTFPIHFQGGWEDAFHFTF